jgi:hypothetical protein
MESEQVETIHWSQLTKGNYGISAEMILNPEGQTIPCKCCISVGTTKKQNSWDVRRVIFDRNYVVNWLIKRVLQTLMITSRDQLYSLVDEAWTIYSPGLQEDENDAIK